MIESCIYTAQKLRGRARGGDEKQGEGETRGILQQKWRVRERRRARERGREGRKYAEYGNVGVYIILVWQCNFSYQSDIAQMLQNYRCRSFLSRYFRPNVIPALRAPSTTKHPPLLRPAFIRNRANKRKRPVSIPLSLFLSLSLFLVFSVYRKSLYIVIILHYYNIYYNFVLFYRAFIF